MLLALRNLGESIPRRNHGKGEGVGVFELVESHDGNSYRAVYTVGFVTWFTSFMRFRKSRLRELELHGPILSLLDHRCEAAQSDYEARYGKTKREQ